MTDSAELLSLLVVVEFAVTAAIVALLVPLDAAIPFLPLAIVFLVALFLYRS
ncbi:hypothetical protein [Haloferax sulfurifontis]|uniref:Uncharacterized protein n=2 Tax=Haloferax sulfurifontis TaxID=255616 RepID=M0INK8_9EURY|nr:hypothetical protein [Haloferax sulfurifontis]ELZ98406.1 hypothetical protein C441_00969 [Haloferax sulfurifontis ATCC BAA-897]GGC60391.1 hypothetical protein GCM10007209_23090 [Haloferax sulfurifontis]